MVTPNHQRQAAYRKRRTEKLKSLEGEVVTLLVERDHCADQLARMIDRCSVMQTALETVVSRLADSPTAKGQELRTIALGALGES